MGFVAVRSYEIGEGTVFATPSPFVDIVFGPGKRMHGLGNVNLRP